MKYGRQVDHFDTASASPTVYQNQGIGDCDARQDAYGSLQRNTRLGDQPALISYQGHLYEGRC